MCRSVLVSDSWLLVILCARFRASLSHRARTRALNFDRCGLETGSSRHRLWTTVSPSLGVAMPGRVEARRPCAVFYRLGCPRTMVALEVGRDYARRLRRPVPETRRTVERRPRSPHRSAGVGDGELEAGMVAAAAGRFVRFTGDSRRSVVCTARSQRSRSCSTKASSPYNGLRTFKPPWMTWLQNSLQRHRPTRRPARR